jgi:hypothetical protein
MYIDTIPSNAARCGVDAAQVKRWRSEEYDSNFEYRFMEALRNQAQHRGFTVHHLGWDSPWLPPRQRRYMETTLQARALRKYLVEAGDFKSKVLDECPDEVDLFASARRYLESLSNLQARVRKAAAAKVDLARDITKQAIDGYGAFIAEKVSEGEVEVAGNPALGLAAIALKNEVEVEAVPVFLDWDDVRRKLQYRNARIANLSVHKVSNWPGTNDEVKGPA